MAIRIGDIYAVETEPGWVKLFHHVLNDASQLNSNVIRAFKPSYAAESLPAETALQDAEIDFHAHTLCALGIKMGLWKKVGHQEPKQGIDLWLRDSNDYGDPKIRVSNDWWVWQVGQPRKRIGPLRGQYLGAEIGIVFSPPAIVSRVKTGDFDIVYPAYE